MKWHCRADERPNCNLTGTLQHVWLWWEARLEYSDDPMLHVHSKGFMLNFEFMIIRCAITVTPPKRNMCGSECHEKEGQETLRKTVQYHATPIQAYQWTSIMWEG